MMSVIINCKILIQICIEFISEIIFLLVFLTLIFI